MLNGTASYDSEGAIVSYRWEQISCPTLNLLYATSPAAYFEAPKQRGPASMQLIFGLSVVDSDGGESVDQVAVAVSR